VRVCVYVHPPVHIFSLEKQCDMMAYFEGLSKTV